MRIGGTVIERITRPLAAMQSPSATQAFGRHDASYVLNCDSTAPNRPEHHTPIAGGGRRRIGVWAGLGSGVGSE